MIEAAQLAGLQSFSVAGLEFPYSITDPVLKELMELNIQYAQNRLAQPCIQHTYRDHMNDSFPLDPNYAVHLHTDTDGLSK